MRRQFLCEIYKSVHGTKKDLLRAIPGELSGKVLVCWCWPDQCHGDILAYLANNPDRIEEFRQGKNPMKGKVQSTLGSFE
ncbi:hypothetical protein MSMTP_1889 [Methanosarcina sp. MTP4]|uniref:DUF4326 domain-containing protein n=1 Tax=Methanosarcina sp. MTP4 TaxID=1434100 RepID=UPI0006155C14|nr:hypothetical protein MSMTP_1889 [Methanosarcina sp. MTP4]